ncbi:MAG: hypothetical protein WAW90_03060 [Minisyncoccia bacterium]
MIDTYTRLLEVVAETGDKATADSAITKLILHLKSVGHMNMLEEVAHELRKVAARRHALRPRVEVASIKESAVALRSAAALGISAQEVQVNHSLIRGWRAQGNGKLVDHSAKYALTQIYQKVTT